MHVPAEMEPGDTLLLVLAITVNKCPFHSVVSATFFTFLCFNGMISLFRHNAEALCAVPKGEKLWGALWSWCSVLEELPLGLSYNAVAESQMAGNEKHTLSKVSLYRKHIK